MDELNVIIKVGKKSNIKLHNVKCHRAITFGDIDILQKKYASSVVIIDNICYDEYANASRYI